MASIHAVYRATFARQDRERAQAAAYQRKHGLVRPGLELRRDYLRGLYAYYLPRLDSPERLTRHHAAAELAKILKEAAQIERRLKAKG